MSFPHNCCQYNCKRANLYFLWKNKLIQVCSNIRKQTDNWHNCSPDLGNGSECHVECEIANNACIGSSMKV